MPDVKPLTMTPEREGHIRSWIALDYHDPGSHVAKVRDCVAEIDALRAKLAEVEQMYADMKACADRENSAVFALAASQAREAKLREAMEHVMYATEDDRLTAFANGAGLLEEPSDTSALREMLTRAATEAWDVALKPHTADFSVDHRGLDCAAIVARILSEGGGK